MLVPHQKQGDAIPFMKTWMEIPRPGLLKWRTAVRIRTFWWWLTDLVSLSKVYSTPESVYPKTLRFWPCLWT